MYRVCILEYKVFTVLFPCIRFLLPRLYVHTASPPRPQKWTGPQGEGQERTQVPIPPRL